MKNQKFSIIPVAGLLILLMIFFIVGGCSWPSQKKVKDTESQIRNIVIKYNETLPLAYAGETEILNSVATEREIRRVELFKVQLADENKVIRVNTISLKVDKIERGSSESVTVNTVEIWEYRYLDSTTYKPLCEWKKIRYNAVYTLISSEQGWLVDDINFEEELVT
ncbi:hypothetical protein [Phosphitispora sp. TUW77]|uniref:hypothetical protein n=1 Tax=Phosphitispora sp. TUW77 TaxID=3152361 RepID=UPI003AB58600